MIFNKIKISFPIVFICCIYFSKVTYSQNNNFQRKEAEVFNAASQSYFTTEDKNVSINYIINKYASGDFKSLKQNILNAGIPKQYYWVHFNVDNTSTSVSSLVIDIENPRLNELELFEVSGNSLQSLGKLGDFYPFFQRAVLNKNFVYPVSVLPGKKKEYFLFINQTGSTFILPIEIYTEKKFRSTTFNDYLFDGVTYGILLFVAVVSFLFFLTSKHYLYLYYCLYIISAIVWFLSYFGLGYQYIWGNYPPLNTAMAPAMASVNILLNLQICQILLRLSKTKRLLNRLINFTKLALLVLALYPLIFNLNNYGYTLNYSYLLVFLSTILFAMMLVSFSVIFYSIKGFIAARFYLIASLLKAGSIINLALLELGITPALYNMEEILQIGIFIEITLLTYALAIRYTNFKARTFAKVIEAHENERALISKEIHDGIKNSLTGINYSIGNFKKEINDLPLGKKMEAEKIFQKLKKVEMEARNVSHNTMPDYIKQNSIAEIVEKYVDEIQSKIKNSAEEGNFIQINFSTNKQLKAFSEVVKLNIFRIIQEITANVLRHSKARSFDILFSFSKKGLVIIAEDNGVGFIEKNNIKEKGMGLKNVQTRVELLEGAFVLKSPAYKKSAMQGNSSGNLPFVTEYGTLITIKIPYRNNLLKNKTSHEY